MIGVVSFHTKMDLAQNDGILLSFWSPRASPPDLPASKQQAVSSGEPGDRGDLKVDPRFCGPKIPGNGATLAWFFCWVRWLLLEIYRYSL